MFLFFSHSDDYLPLRDLSEERDAPILKSNSTAREFNHIDRRRLNRRNRTRPLLAKEHVASQNADVYANDRVVAKFSAQTFSVTDHVQAAELCGQYKAGDRIMISGITSHYLATELAITLAEVCGVRQIVGFVDHLLTAEESLRLEFLYRRIPTLKIGLLTGKLDRYVTRQFFESFQPTHVFFFQAEVDEDRLFGLGLEFNNLQQICDTIIKLKSQEQVGPTFLYVSSGLSKSKKNKLVMESAHIILGSYHKKYGLDARALRLPFILGPNQEGAAWLRSDEFVSTVTEMNNPSTKTISTPPKLAEPIVSITDAIQSVLACTKSGGNLSDYEWIPSFSAPKYETNLLNLLSSKINEKSHDSSILPIVSWNHKRAKPYRDPTVSDSSPMILENDKLIALGLNNTRHHLGKDKGIENSAFSLLERRQHNLFPCVSVCASHVECKSSIWDSVAQISKTATKDCKAVLYTAAFSPFMTILPAVKESYNGMKFPRETLCQVAFLSSDSVIFKDAVAKESKNRAIEEINGKVSKNGWILVAVDGKDESMERSDLVLPKTNPESLFSPNVDYAIYIEPRHYKFVPPLQICYEIIQRMVVGAELIDNYLTPKRDTVLFTHTYFADTENELDQTKPDFISQASRFIRQQNNDRKLSDDKAFRKFFVTRQNEAYTRSLLWQKEDLEFTLVDTSFMILSLQNFRSRQLRCEWYEEELFWSNEDNVNLEALSLAFVLHRWRRRAMLKENGMLLLSENGEHLPPSATDFRKSKSSIGEDGNEPSQTRIEQELGKLEPTFHIKIHDYITLRHYYPPKSFAVHTEKKKLSQRDKEKAFFAAQKTNKF